MVAKRLRVPYPIAFVIGGVALSFSRHLPHPHIDPDVVMLVVIPPLLYGAAWSTDWVEFKRAAMPITLHAVGLVIFTMAIVAVVVHFTVPEFTWPLAFTLGAIVSPPDAVASEAIFERLAIPRRVAAIVSGECLMNDATALVLYRFALAARDQRRLLADAGERCVRDRRGRRRARRRGGRVRARRGAAIYLPGAATRTR